RCAGPGARGGTVKDDEALMKRYEEIAVAFASALVNGDFEHAHRLLAPELRSEFSPQALRDRLHAMFEGHADGPPTRIDFDSGFSLDDWPAKQPGDAGSTYVGILGEDFVEAVSVIVAEISGALLIREIEWGRP